LKNVTLLPLLGYLTSPRGHNRSKALFLPNYFEMKSYALALDFRREWDHEAIRQKVMWAAWRGESRTVSEPRLPCLIVANWLATILA
jgi:hypothetical protein